MSEGNRLRVTWVRSAIGHGRRQRATLRGLGFKRLNQTVDLPDEPAIRGMVVKVGHLVRVED